MVLSKPSTTAWGQLVPPLPKLARPLRVAMPCVGIDGCGSALDSMGVDYIPCNVYDLDERYKKHLVGHFKNNADGLFLGKKSGNLTNMALKDLKLPFDLLCSGPPCPPWAGNGNKKGLHDKRADVFVEVVKWTVRAIKNGGLLAVILENVLGVLQDVGGKMSFMKQLLATLEKEVPEFTWEVVTLKAVDYYLAQSRVRVFLRGMRNNLLGSAGVLPAVLEPFGKRDLAEFLDMSLPATPREQLTRPQQQNLNNFINKLKGDKKAGLLDDVSFAIFAVDRAEGKVFQARYHKDICPTLTCNNKYLFIVSVTDLGEKADDEMLCFRFFHPRERFRLQGFDAKIYDKLSSDACALKAAGNAYPVPLLVANLHGIVNTIANSTIKLKSWPQDIMKVDDEHILAQVESALRAPPTKKTQVKKKPAALEGQVKKRPAKPGDPTTEQVKKRPASVAPKMKRKHAVKRQRLPEAAWISSSSSS